VCVAIGEELAETLHRSRHIYPVDEHAPELDAPSLSVECAGADC
jgi:hypothetical protein